MFLGFDSSEEYAQKIFGAVSMPRQEISELEKEWTKLRIQHKLFGEIKWSNIDKNYKKYFDFLSLFFKGKKINFHSICFRDNNQKYRSAYMLIREISWKMKKSGVTKPLFVLFDNDGNIGKKETTIIKNYLDKDKRFSLNIDFCNQGASHILSLLQITDLLTGATASRINKIKVNAKQLAIINFIETKSNTPLGWSSERFPDLYEFKIHHFKPDSSKANF
jgi:hypothetical protein